MKGLTTKAQLKAEQKQNRKHLTQIFLLVKFILGMIDFKVF